MPLYKPRELLAYLTSLGIQPKKALSQNFLIDHNIIERIVKAAGVVSGDLVVEIGPGPGALTEELLKRGATVIAIEKDPQLAKGLGEALASPHLTVHCEDVLSFDFTRQLQGLKKAKIIANLPYRITTPILTKCIAMDELFSELTLMVQDEVAHRIVAEKNSKDYSSLTLYLQLYAKARYCFKVSSHCFYPKPSVESAVVNFKLQKPLLKPCDLEGVNRMIKRAFEQRRKLLTSSLSLLYDPEQIRAALAQIGKTATARPQELTCDEFIALYQAIVANG